MGGTDVTAEDLRQLMESVEGMTSILKQLNEIIICIILTLEREGIEIEQLVERGNH